jgi:hypothetical protein
MSTTAIPAVALPDPTERQQEQEKPFDAKAFLAARNAADISRRTPLPAVAPKKEEPKAAVVTPAAVEPPKPGKPAEAVEAKPAAEETQKPAESDDEVQPAHRMSRSERRAMNRLREEVGAERAKREMLEQELEKLRSQQNGRPAVATASGAPTVAPPSDDLEPKQETFNTEGEYLRALAKWEGRQAARTELAKRETAEADSADRQRFVATVREMDEKAAKDRELFPDWEDKTEEAKEELAGLTWSADTTFAGLMATSDQRTALLYHFVEHPNVLKKLLELSDNPGEQIRQFARLEGKVEDLYGKPEADKNGKTAAPAAQAAPKVEAKPQPQAEDRNQPADGDKPGRTAVERDLHKPKPSSEVSAPGGSAAPPEPPIGSAAWIARRNQAQYGR